MCRAQPRQRLSLPGPWSAAVGVNLLSQPLAAQAQGSLAFVDFQMRLQPGALGQRRATAVTRTAKGFLSRWMRPCLVRFPDLVDE